MDSIKWLRQSRSRWGSREDLMWPWPHRYHELHISAFEETTLLTFLLTVVLCLGLRSPELPVPFRVSMSMVVSLFRCLGRHLCETSQVCVSSDISRSNNLSANSLFLILTVFPPLLPPWRLSLPCGVVLSMCHLGLDLATPHFWRWWLSVMVSTRNIILKGKTPRQFLWASNSSWKALSS